MRSKGFTLIELLVVITILAILAGAALPYVQNYVAESRIAKAKTDLEEVARAIAVYETREGEYPKSDVSDLTGRYLNKAPIDPWGKSYQVATDSGLVISGGPDRDVSTAEDNIQVPYQPPLALVSVKWVDKNQSGAVDTQNTNDQIQLLFSRKLGNVIADLQSNTDNYFVVNGTSTAFNVLFDEANVKVVASKTVIFDILIDDAFVAGQSSIEVISGHGTLKDMAAGTGNLCLASQAVIISPL